MPMSLSTSTTAPKCLALEARSHHWK
uniref:Uncharacterized protein n=1 Tax=Rhizophora mucronata TaxID=61149 RepID=A0A2P2PDI1_RHIMU